MPTCTRLFSRDDGLIVPEMQVLTRKGNRHDLKCKITTDTLVVRQVHDKNRQHMPSTQTFGHSNQSNTNTQCKN
jgi:hypothetical protein